MQAVRKKELPRLRYIKLWRESGQYLRFPMGAFNTMLKKTKSLPEELKYSGSLEPEQVTVMDFIKNENRRTGLIEMKTGRGKSHIIMAIATHFQEPILVVCHTLSSVYDMEDKFKEFLGVTPGRYGGNKKEIRDITITTHRSFVLKKDDFKSRYGIIVIDECDYNLSEDMVDAIIDCDADGLFGLSGTPKRKELDVTDMEFIFGKHIKVLGQDNNGYNIIPDVLRIEYFSDRTYSFGTQRHMLKEALLNDEDRTNQQIKWILEQMQEGKIKYGLLLVERKEQECDKYYKLLAPHIKCCIINGDTKQEDDRRNIEEVRASDRGIIVGTVGKIGRGKDIPMIDGVFLLFPSRFENNTIQAVGRGLRKYSHKEKCLLVDRCDMPILKGQASERTRTYMKEYTADVKITTIKVLPVNEPNELFKL